MQQFIVDQIRMQLEGMADFTVGHYPCELTPTEIYEDLIGEEHVLKAFANAGQYLAPSGLAKRLNVQLEGPVTKPVQLALRLPPCVKYPQYLLPSYDLKLTADTKLYKALEPQLQIIDDWNNLIYVWNRLAPFMHDMHALGFIMPWARSLASDIHNDRIMEDKQRKTIVKIKSELKALANDRMPGYCPRLTTLVSGVCRSGDRLITQYRMLQAGDREYDRAYVSMARIDDHSAAVRDSVDEIISEWAN